MKNDERADRPERKPTRLQTYDYSAAGHYFITICTAECKEILSSIRFVGEGLCALPQTVLTDIGKAVEDSIKFTDNKYQNAKIDKYVIMPNHLHMIIQLTGGHGSPPLRNVIGLMKSYTTKVYGAKLWQRSYYDHVIRNEQDYRRICKYIDDNPAKWAEDKYYTK